MKYNCERCMEHYLSLDKGKRLPAGLSRHLLTCTTCRRQVEALSHAEKIATEPLRVPTPVQSDSIAAIMKQLDPLYKPKKIRVPLWLWITMGVLMIAAMMFFTVPTSSASDHHIMFSFYLVFAGIVTAYCAAFIGSNMDVFIKKSGATPA